MMPAHARGCTLVRCSLRPALFWQSAPRAMTGARDAAGTPERVLCVKHSDRDTGWQRGRLCVDRVWWYTKSTTPVC